MSKVISPGLLSVITFLILSVVLASAVSARGPAITDIQNGDTIYIYETGLDISALKGGIPDSIISLIQYVNEVPGTSRNLISVNNENSFNVLTSMVNGYYGLYYANNQSGLITDGGTQTVNIQEPTLSIQTVLSPGHQVVEGFSISNQNDIAFKVTNNVASGYRVGGTYPATISIVVTEPGGSETYRFGGANLQDLSVDSAQFYTDDKTTACSLNDLGAGTYQAYAEWSNAPFENNAPNSNTITFEVKGRVDFPSTTETTATTSATATATATTATPTPTPTPTYTSVITKTVTPTTATPTATPTETVTTPLNPMIALFALISAITMGLLFRPR